MEPKFSLKPQNMFHVLVDDTVLTWAKYGEMLVNHSNSMSQISLVYVRNVFLWIHIVFIYVFHCYVI